jgi:tRNA-Thr(GGU) m(6)t(6)A37 methyltransferase TsaA
MAKTATFSVRPIGFVRSRLANRNEAPRQGHEDAPDAWLEVAESVAEALDGIIAGQEIIVITWLHQASRSVLKLHPRGDRALPLTGVFLTRSPDRPNPVGLHRVKVLEIADTRGIQLRVAPLEATDGTPIVDIKPVLSESADF